MTSRVVTEPGDPYGNRAGYLAETIWNARGQISALWLGTMTEWVPARCIESMDVVE